MENQLCPCSKLEWLPEHLTLEHHPDCETNKSKDSTYIRFAKDKSGSIYHILSGEPLMPNDHAFCGISVLSMCLFPAFPENATVCQDCRQQHINQVVGTLSSQSISRTTTIVTEEIKGSIKIKRTILQFYRDPENPKKVTDQIETEFAITSF